MWLIYTFQFPAQKPDLKALLSIYFLSLITKFLQCWEGTKFEWNTGHLRCFIFFLEVKNPHKAIHLPERLTVQNQFNWRLGNFSFRGGVDTTKGQILGQVFTQQI